MEEASELLERQALVAKRLMDWEPAKIYSRLIDSVGVFARDLEQMHVPFTGIGKTVT